MQNFLYRSACAAALFGLLGFCPVGRAQDAGASAGQASGTKRSARAGGDHRFVMDAAQGGLAEVELGRVALQKASSDDVKTFAQRMIDDHSKANDQLKQVAQQAGVTVPTDTDAKHKAAMSHMQNLSGAAFDRAYMRHMVQDHKKDVAEFQKEANRGSDPNVKEFAQSTLPTLREHLKMAQEIAAKPKGSNTADRHK